MATKPAPVLQQNIPALPAGANGIMNAGIIKQQQMANQQNALVNGVSTGGYRYRTRTKSRSRKHRGGANASYVVPAPPSYASNPSQTQNSYKQLTDLAVNQSTQAGYDSCIGAGPACTSAVYQQQVNAQKAGRRRRRRTRRRTRRRSRRIRRS